MVYLGSTTRRTSSHRRRLRLINALLLLAIHNAIGINIPTPLYGSERWVLEGHGQKKNERKMNAVKMRSLHRICGVSLADRICNEAIQRMGGTSEEKILIMEK